MSIVPSELQLLPPLTVSATPRYALIWPTPKWFRGSRTGATTSSRSPIHRRSLQIISRGCWLDQPLRAFQRLAFERDPALSRTTGSRRIRFSGVVALRPSADCRGDVRLGS